MRYGFVIDQRKCIGCHACTVACKTENRVPVGSFRTWVKYVEKGEYPQTRRHFGVMRCNHCENAPCVKICPVNALHTRPDGIVDLDGGKCIGCQSCMQACPYDAIYINPDRGVAEKCHYCAHRVERGLEPACVVVCPVQAIIPGDLDNPNAEITQLVARLPSQVRKPEQGTKPKVFYLGADQDAISPGGSSDIPASYLWSEGPAEILQQMMDPSQLPATREVYNVSHHKPWGWHISAYLWTKSIAAGAAIVGAFTAARSAPMLALIFLAITTALLIGDLKRPERFWRLILAPNFTSWLVWGGYILMVFGGTLSLWWLLGAQSPTWLLYVNVAFGAAAAGYSAFLFAQAEGRDFWQSPLLLPHLLAQSLIAGAGALALLGATNVGAWLAAGLALHLLMIFGELAVPHTNRDSAMAAKFMLRHRAVALMVLVGVGAIVPLVLIPWGFGAAAGVLALAGLYIYEHIWIEAGQSVPLS